MDPTPILRIQDDKIEKPVERNVVYDNKKESGNLGPVFELTSRIPEIKGYKQIDLTSLAKEKLEVLEQIISSQIFIAESSVPAEYLNCLANLRAENLIEDDFETGEQKLIEKGGSYIQRDAAFEKVLPKTLSNLLRVINTGSYFIHPNAYEEGNKEYASQLPDAILKEALRYALNISSKSGHNRGRDILRFFAENPSKVNLIDENYKKYIPALFLRDFCDFLYASYAGGRTPTKDLQIESWNNAKYIMTALGLTDEMLKESFHDHPDEHTRNLLAEYYSDFLKARKETSS